MNIEDIKCKCEPETAPEVVRGVFRTEDLINEEDISSFLSAVPNNLGITNIY